MNRTGKFAVAGLLGVLFFALGLGPLFGSLLYTLTPLQRHYLPAYIASSWHGNDPAAETEVRWVLKLRPPKPEPKSKKERGPKPVPMPDLGIAGERDVVAVPVTARLWSGDALPFRLSEDAAREGWTGLAWGYPRQVRSPELANVLREEYFEGRAWERFFVQPAGAAVSLLFLVLIGGAGIRGWRDRRLWGSAVYRRELLWRWMFEPPTPTVHAPRQLLAEAGRSAPLTLSAPAPAAEFVAAPKQPRIVESASPVPPTKSAYLWDETAGID